jgi:hypothetical protein
LLRLIALIDEPGATRATVKPTLVVSETSAKVLLERLSDGWEW